MPSRRAVLRSTLAAGSLVVAGCSTAPETPAQRPPESLGPPPTPAPDAWPTPDRDARRTRRAPDATGPGPDAAVRWGTPVPDDPADAGVSVGALTPETVYLTTFTRGDGVELHARSLVDGTTRWSRVVDADGTSRPTLADGTLYVSTRDGVAALDADGTERWRTDLYARLAEAVHESFLPERERFTLSTPVVGDGQVFVTSEFGVHGLSASDGSETARSWVEGMGHVRAPPTVGDGTLYAVGSDALYALAPGDDPVPLLGDAGTNAYPPDLHAPALGPDRLFVTVRGTGVETPFTLRSVARYPGNGRTSRWSFLGHYTSAPAGRHVTPPAVVDGGVLVGDVVPTGGTLAAAYYRLHPDDGTVAWAHRVAVENDSHVDPPPLPVLTPPAVAGETCFVAVAPVVDGFADRIRGTRAEIRALDAETGEPRWTRSLPFHPRSLAVAGDFLVAWNDDGRLAVLG